MDYMDPAVQERPLNLITPSYKHWVAKDKANMSVADFFVIGSGEILLALPRQHNWLNMKMPNWF